MVNVSLVIATLFEPSCMDLLMQKARWAGIEDINVVKGMTTNAAWNRGLDEAEHDRVIILNDDIEVNDGFFQNMVKFAYDFSWMPATCASFNGYRQAIRLVRDVYINEHWLGNDYDMSRLPQHVGHAFVVAKNAPRIPGDLLVFYGDDWFTHWAVGTNSCGVCEAAQFKSGKSIGHGEGMSGYTQHHKDIDVKMLDMTGMTMYEVERRDHAFAEKYFEYFEKTEDSHLYGIRDVIGYDIKGHVMRIKEQVLEGAI